MKAFKGIVCAVACLLTVGLFAQTDVYEDGQLPDDSRLGELRHLNNYFPFAVPDTARAWETRRDHLRMRLRVALGLWPQPAKTPLNAKIYGKSLRDGFTIEKVHFESYPGHFVSGLLFRPEAAEGKSPAVLTPHGHGGRMQDHGDGIKELIENGDEKFENSGRFPKLARCAQLARMGCVTFIYDMEGYVDSLQIPMEVSHRLNDRRPDLESPSQWGFFSAQAEMRMQSIMGVQTWNSIRALDFLQSLPDVDGKRIGITGGSGGGTQTILLGALDARPIVSFPQGMVSTAMQGGCPCENCSLLRVDTGNIELTALFAPRPIAMTGANDWTKDIQTKGYPELQQLYKMVGDVDDVFCVSYLNFGHNYNYVTRRHMYHWFNKHMNLGLEEPIVEQDWKPLTPEEYSVWDDEHPAPEAGVPHEIKLLRAIDKDSNRQIARVLRSAENKVEALQGLHGAALKAIVGRGLSSVDEISRVKVGKFEREGYHEFTDILRYDPAGEELPVASFFPTKTKWTGTVVVWADGQGKAGMYGDDGKPNKEIASLLAEGVSVIGADLLYQGEFLKEGTSLDSQRLATTTSRKIPAYTYGYNNALFVQRVHDLLTLISFVANDEHGTKNIVLVGANGAGPIAATARALAGEKVHTAIIDTNGFRFGNITQYDDVNFLPGAIKYGDLPGILALSAPYRLMVVGEDVPAFTKAIYEAAGARVKSAKTIYEAF